MLACAPITRRPGFSIRRARERFVELNAGRATMKFMVCGARNTGQMTNKAIVCPIHILY